MPAPAGRSRAGGRPRTVSARDGASNVRRLSRAQISVLGASGAFVPPRVATRRPRRRGAGCAGRARPRRARSTAPPRAAARARPAAGARGRRRGPSAPGSSTASCRITGPVSTPPSSSTKWTVTPNTLTPYSSACSIARTPRKAGSSEGWMLMTAPGKRLRKRARQQRHVAGEHDELDVVRAQPVGDRAVARGAVGVLVEREHGGLDAGVAGAIEGARARACRRRRRRRPPRCRARCRAAPAGSCPRRTRARRRAAARPSPQAASSLGYIPPVERSRPAEMSSSTRASTCAAVMWSNVP